MITVSDIHYAAGGQPILRGVSVSVRLGDFVLVTGANGTGKSTLLKIILGIIKGYAGLVNLSAGCRLGYVPQTKTFDKHFPATALELVLTGSAGRWQFRPRKCDIKHALQALDLVNATNIAGAQLAGLSGGELQKVYLARALAAGPDVLLLDEPTAALDAGSEADILRHIIALNAAKKTAIVMVTHNTDIVKSCATKTLELTKIK